MSLLTENLSINSLILWLRAAAVLMMFVWFVWRWTDRGLSSWTASSRKKSISRDAFQISFPMRTNYMYGRVKRTLLQEIFALTLCLWIKAGSGPGLGTPFSYSAPGQSNELVLIEWGNNPMELLVDDKVRTKVRTKNFVNQDLLTWKKVFHYFTFHLSVLNGLTGVKQLLSNMTDRLYRTFKAKL